MLADYFPAEAVRKKLWRLDRMKILVCLIVLVNCGLVGCGKSTQQRVDEAARAIRDGLYVPRDAVFLGEVQSNEFLAYSRGCTGTYIEIAYGVNRSLEEMVAEYQQQLLSEGWILHPGYNTDEDRDHAYFQNGIETKVSITGLLVLITIDVEVSSQYSTIYAIKISYVEPSVTDCTG